MTADAVELVPVAGGVRIRLRVKPGARRNRLLRAHAGALKLEVTAPPERGKANTAVINLLAELLAIPRKTITITAGTTSQDKTILIQQTTPETLATALANHTLRCQVRGSEVSVPR